jgi:outer membrane cobalamin receptor
MINRKLLFALVSLGLLSCVGTYAQSTKMDTVDIYEMSLEELMNIPIAVSKSDLNAREAPSVISVITREEILNMGARDLMDVLNQVPGFTMALDGLNLVDVGTRGIWAHEGRLLLLIDGQEMNEILFGTNHFGQHYDINNIERIEIIRGPGSSIYGGYAELGVINVITRKGKDIMGAEVNGLYGVSSNATTRAAGNVIVGGANDNNIDYSLSAQYGKGLRSDQMYTDIAGNTADLSKYSHLRPFTINGSFSAGGFSSRVLIDKYQVETIDGFGVNTSTADNMKFTYVIADAKYDWKASDKLQVTPRMNVKYGSPYNTTPESNFIYLIESRRIAPSVNINWTPTDNISIVAGADSYFDHAKNTSPSTGYFINLGGTNETSPLYDIGLFAQGVIKAGEFNITIGSRFDRHNLFGNAFSPRVGITRAFERFHFKALYSRAFRAPGIEYLNYNPDVNPEKTGVAELELGVKLTENMLLTGNIFHIHIDGPLVFQADAASPIGGYYVNFSKTGSMGFELDYRIKYKWGYINANYAYYNSKNLNAAPIYQVPSNERESLGFPPSRFNMAGSIKLVKGLSLNPSANILSSRYATTSMDTNGDYVYTKLDSEVFFNLFLRYSKDNLSLGLGVFDLFDQRQTFVQASAGGHSPLPGIGREFNVRVGYKIQW